MGADDDRELGRGELAAEFRFYAELNDFLRPGRRQRTLRYRFRDAPAVKDPIEAHGVPHSEVELIVVNGRSVGFDYRLRDGDRVAVYPVFEALDVGRAVRLRERPLRRTAFVLDVHLGKLAPRLRLLGMDALYRNDYDDAKIVRIAREERRIILTRDRRLLHERTVTHGYWLRRVDPDAQALEVLRRFDLFDRLRPFTRCLACNGTIERVAAHTVRARLPPAVRRLHTEFARCTRCGRVYWKGTHYGRLLGRIERITGRQL